MDSFDATRDVPLSLREQFKEEMIYHYNTIVQPWHPWWMIGQGTSTVDIQYDLRNIPSFTSFINQNKQPSPLLPLITIDILFAYAYVSRRFNGEHLAEPEAIQLLLQLCGAFAVPPVAPSDSVEQWQMRARDCANHASLGAQSAEQTLLAFRDTVTLMSAPSHVIRALWETHAMLASQQKRSKRCALACKKALFFLSWAVSLRPDLSTFQLALD